jgi:iron complex outermembrane receptor protein
VGSNNVLDTYPDKWDENQAFPFPQLGFTYGWETLPFGINGAYYYAKVDWKF